MCLVRFYSLIKIQRVQPSQHPSCSSIVSEEGVWRAWVGRHVASGTKLCGNAWLSNGTGEVVPGSRHRTFPSGRPYGGGVLSVWVDWGWHSSQALCTEQDVVRILMPLVPFRSVPIPGRGGLLFAIIIILPNNLAQERNKVTGGAFKKTIGTPPPQHHVSAS